MRQEIEMNNSTTNGIETNGFSDIYTPHSNFDQFEKYPINILKEPNDKLPPRINPLNKEVRKFTEKLMYSSTISICKSTNRITFKISLLNRDFKFFPISYK